MRIIHIDFYHDCKRLLQQYTRRLPCLCKDSDINNQLVSVCLIVLFLMTVILIGVRWIFNVLLIWIFLMAKATAHYFSFLGHLCSFPCCLLNLSADFFSCFGCLNQSSLQILSRHYFLFSKKFSCDSTKLHATIISPSCRLFDFILYIRHSLKIPVFIFKFAISFSYRIIS